MKKRLLSIGVLLCVLVGAFAAFLLYTPSHGASAKATSMDIATANGSNTLPRGSYNNHFIHLHPASQVMADPINFSLTGTNLPTGALLKFYSDFDGRCASNTLDGHTTFVSGDGTFGPLPFTASDCPVGNYLIEAIDPLNRVYNAILTISS